MIYNSVLPYSFKENLYAVKSLFFNERQIIHFESLLSEYTGKSVAALDSGLSAIRIFLRTSELSPGDEIAVPAYLCERAGDGILNEGYRLNFIDVDDNYNISLRDLEKKISNKTKAVLSVHSYGIPCDIFGIKELSKRHKSIVVEDSAQSFGGKYRNQLLGTIGDGGVYSFGWFKPMTAMGGGALVSNNKELIENVKTLTKSNHDFNAKMVKLFKSVLYVNKWLYYKTAVKSYNNVGTNCKNVQPFISNTEQDMPIAYRIQNIQASIGMVQLKKIEKFNSKRIINAKKIIRSLSSMPIRFPSGALEFPLLRLPALFYKFDKTKVVEISKLFREKGIDAPILYPFLPDLLGIEAKCPNARFLSERTLHFPVHPCLDESDIAHIVNIAKAILSKV